MSYQYRAVKQSPPTEKELTRLGIETKKLITRIHTATTERDRLRQDLGTIREETEEAKRLIDHARATRTRTIAAANTEAAGILLDAEREAATIKERAHRQAWALRDRAYTDGATRQRDQARARTTVLNRKKAA